MLKKQRKWYNRHRWLVPFLAGVGLLHSLIQPSGGSVLYAIVFGTMAICSLSWAMAITLRDTGFFSPLNCVNPGERWQARLVKEDDHLTIELSPFSSDRPRLSDGSEYYDVSFKISDS